MNVFILRVRSEETKKDYYFSNITNAAIFETKFLSEAKKESRNVTTEILYKDLKETKLLLREMANDPIKYARSEYMQWFHPEEVRC